MADPLLIPQSAAPLGQSPYSEIQRPGVGVSIPNGIDSRSLYNTLGSIGNSLNSALALRNQKIDEQAAELDKIQAIAAGVNDAFDKLYEQDKSLSPKSIGGLPGLDARFKGPRRVNKEISASTSKLYNQLDAIRSASVEPGALSSAKDFANFERELDKAVNEQRLELAQNQDYIKYQRALQAYSNIQDQIKAATTKGKSVHPKYRNMLRKFEAYLNEEPGVFISQEELDPSQYIFDPKEATDKLTADLKNRFKPVNNSEVMDVEGNKIERVVTTTPTVEEEMPSIMESLGSDSDIDGMYQLAKAAGIANSKEEWLRAKAEAFAQPKQVDFGTKLYNKPAPRRGKTSPSSSSSDASGSPKNDSPRTYQYFNDVSTKTSEEAEWIKDTFDMSTGSGTDVVEGTAVAGEIGQFGFDYRTSNNFGNIVDLKVKKVPLEYKYDPISDHLVVGTMERAPGLYARGTVFSPVSIVRGKFSDYDTNDNIPDRLDRSDDPNDYLLPENINKLPTELQLPALRNVTAPSEMARLESLSEMFNNIETVTADQWNRMGLGNFKKGRFFNANTQKEYRKEVLMKEMNKIANKPESQTSTTPGGNNDPSTADYYGFN